MTLNVLRSFMFAPLALLWVPSVSGSALHRFAYGSLRESVRISSEASLDEEGAAWTLENGPVEHPVDGVGMGNSTSLVESEGFFDEPDVVWAMRKERHRRQMRLQNEIMVSCPPESFPRQRVCMPGCTPWTPNCLASTFWQVHYEPTISCEFEARIGNAGEGGKWVCDPHKLKAKSEAGKGCLVYSIGSHDQFDFEKAVHTEISSKCEIHTMDMKDWRAYGSIPAPDYVNYHVYTLGEPPATPVPAIVRDLGHAGRTIDLFKIDCDGCEFPTYHSWFGEGIYIRQILVEVHGTDRGTGVHTFFNFLFDQGYVVFHKEPNTLGCQGDCLEYAFIKMDPSFARTPL